MRFGQFRGRRAPSLFGASLPEPENQSLTLATLIDVELNRGVLLRYAKNSLTVFMLSMTPFFCN